MEGPPGEAERRDPLPPPAPGLGLHLGAVRMSSNAEAQSPVKTSDTGHFILNKLKREQLAR